MLWVWIALASVLSAVLYRLGGASKEDAKKEFPWIPRWLREIPKSRDVGCSLVACALLWLVILPNVGCASPWWIYLISFGLLWGALSTYHDTMFYNWMKPEDNFWIHGFVCGLAFLLFAIHNPTLWMWFGIRAAVMAVFMGLWSHVLFSDALAEELGRGAVIPLSLGLILCA